MSSGVWLTLAAAAERVGRSRRTIDRWVAEGAVVPVMGRIKESALLETDRRKRESIGRPRTARNSPEPVEVVAAAIADRGDAEAAVGALRQAGLL